MTDEPAESDLAAAVLDTLLRENFAGLATYVKGAEQEPVLTLPGLPDLPLEPDGFLTDFRIRRPCPALTLDDVHATLGTLAGPEDQPGVEAFAHECRDALAARHLRDQEIPRVTRALIRRQPPDWCGVAGQAGYDTLAAVQPHPAYPTAAARPGFTDDDALAYAPEYQPQFPLSWVAIPREAVTRGGPPPPAWWPRPSDVGLPAGLDAGHDLFPVHPLTARRALAPALAEAGLPAAKLMAPGLRLKVTPTLSTRTVAVTGQPGVHLKLPLPTSTLVRLHQRAIVPGTLADGALVRAIVAGVAPDTLLLADESRYAHAGHPFLGYLMRQFPDGLDRCHVVPLAALLASPPALTGRPPELVMTRLAREHGDGTVAGLFRDYLNLLFGLHVGLFVRYGIALESHQQNAALVLDPDEDGRPLRLLIKDFSGALLHHQRLAAALATSPVGVPEPAAFADQRLLTGSDDALADVFITTTVHLCAGALAFGLAERGQAPRPALLTLVRDALTRALDRYPGHPAAAVLRARVLDADRLPGQAMVTAGTLQSKARSGASDINKSYGPNYLAMKASGDCSLTARA